MNNLPVALLPSICAAIFLSLSDSSLADEANAKAAPSGAAAETLVFHTAWKGERIPLPPPFAPAMKLKGIEEIRFAPGMFDAASDTFFTYALVFSVPKDQQLTPQMIQQEILEYYRGLAGAILKGKGVDADTGKFTFKLEQAKEATGTPEKVPASAKAIQYHGELTWVEPFVTAKPQVLHFEIQSWADPVRSRNYLFVCTSPKAIGDSDATWKELRTIRRTFEVKGASGK